MNTEKNEIEYDILGHSLKVCSEEDKTSKVPALDVVNYVRERAAEIKKDFPTLGSDQISILLAMSCAREKLELEIEYKENIEDLESKAKSALDAMESIDPRSNQ